MNDTIKILDFDESMRGAYKAHYADAIILTHDNKILLQYRAAYKDKPALTSAFGGYVENGETIQEAVVREIKEELGADIRPDELIKIVSMSEHFTNHTEAVHVYFWHDCDARITGCYEHSPQKFSSLEEALNAPHLMDYARYTLEECERQGLLNI